MDARRPRDGKAIEELGFYDPMVRETDARAVLNGERIDYWLSVGALPTENVNALIKKYGTNGTRLEEQKAALERVKIRPEAPPPISIPKPKTETPAESEPAASTESGEGAGSQTETPAAESTEANATAE